MPHKSSSNVCVDCQSSSSVLGLVFQLSITVGNIQSSIICLNWLLCFVSLHFSFDNRSYSSEYPLSVCPIYRLCLLLIVCNRNLSSPIIASTYSFPIMIWPAVFLYSSLR